MKLSNRHTWVKDGGYGFGLYINQFHVLMCEFIISILTQLHLIQVCTSLKDPSVRLHEIEISLFSPFRPMLAEIALPNQVR